MRLHKTNTIFFIASLFIFSLSACIKMDNDLENIDAGINFSTVELYQSLDSRPIPALQFFTNEEFDCSNYTIFQRVGGAETTIMIEFEGYKKAANCLERKGPATSTIPVFVENGEYDLYLKYKDHSDLYSFRQSDDAIEVYQPSLYSFSKTNHQILWRYPEKTFALLVGTTAHSTGLYSKIINELKEEFDITEYKFADIGETPYPKSFEGYDVNHPAKYFKYENETDFLLFSNYIRAFGRDNIENTKDNRVAIINWLNNSASTD